MRCYIHCVDLVRVVGHELSHSAEVVVIRFLLEPNDISGLRKDVVLA